MKAKLVNFENKSIKDLELDSSVFGLETRVDIIKRVIDWQLAKARAGTHSVKTVGEVAGSTKKPFRQKGTGRARQGNARGVQRRGGGIAHGPQVRSHAIKLQKKVRALGLKHALSSKFADNKVHFIDSFSMDAPKTSELLKKLSNFGNGKFFLVGGNEVDKNLQLSVRSAVNTKLVPILGMNVYDIIKSDHILLSNQALLCLEERFSNAG